ncbi:hypothetical protein [Hymenobacter sp. CRA2]|uniref:hypothetical protein n=1 Tax=Hymenobacter sp. CRA2 TaxID=1955620 RepID=UPI00098ED499|nr:hypothetical protein [Hymenobacter sp. CRA2]OON67823.1 hypothetical protein B0919_16695 [Hymenobacter sp. CRA2]
MCHSSLIIPLTPAEHAARIGAIADVLAAVTNLPASAPRKQIEGVIVAAFNAAYTARVVQTSRPAAGSMLAEPAG